MICFATKRSDCLARLVAKQLLLSYYLFLSLFVNTKLINCLLCISFSWLQCAAREIWVVWCVREFLCLETYRTAAWECCAMLARNACQEVASVHLKTWLCSIDFHSTAACWVLDAGSEAQLAFLFLVQYIVVVIALTILDLLIVSIDVLTDRLWCAEVEWSAFYLQNLTCRNRYLVDRQVVVCIDLADEVVDS